MTDDTLSFDDVKLGCYVKRGHIQQLIDEWKAAAKTFDGDDERDKIKADNIRKCANELEALLNDTQEGDRE